MKINESENQYVWNNILKSLRGSSEDSSKLNLNIDDLG